MTSLPSGVIQDAEGVCRIMFKPFDFRDLDQLLTDQLRTIRRIPVMPLDAYRISDVFHIDIDIPGVDPDSIEVLVDKNVLTVKAERHLEAEIVDVVELERRQGTFTREILLSESLDSEKIEAAYENGVLHLTMPVIEGRHILVKSATKKETVRTGRTA